jgi:hypothetical protein
MSAPLAPAGVPRRQPHTGLAQLEMASIGICVEPDIAMLMMNALVDSDDRHAWQLRDLPNIITRPVYGAFKRELDAKLPLVPLMSHWPKISSTCPPTTDIGLADQYEVFATAVVDTVDPSQLPSYGNRAAIGDIVTFKVLGIWRMRPSTQYVRSDSVTRQFQLVRFSFAGAQDVPHLESVDFISRPRFTDARLRYMSNRLPVANQHRAVVRALVRGSPAAAARAAQPAPSASAPNLAIMDADSESDEDAESDSHFDAESDVDADSESDVNVD